MDKSLVNPELIVPIARMPVSAGAKVATAPAIGVKVLLGVVDSYSCAVIVIVEPTRLSAAVVLKNAASDVMVPLRGTEKA